MHLRFPQSATIDSLEVMQLFREHEVVDWEPEGRVNAVQGRSNENHKGAIAIDFVQR